MKVLAQSVVGLLIFAHLLFFLLEAVLWRTRLADKAREKLGFVGDQTEVARFAINQGVSNLFLAAGLAWGLWLNATGRQEVHSVLTFFLICIAVAGVVGELSIRPTALSTNLAFLVGQTGLALLAIALLWM
jgi:putative membrane protein